MKHLFWLDLEMSGLDDETHVILEAAVAITTLEFETLEEYHAVVYQTPEALSSIDPWCTKTHGDSGLLDKIPQGKQPSQVENELIALIKRHYPKDEKVILCGNSISNDRRFIDRYWPNLAKQLHYRSIDVSSFKEVFKAKYNVQFKKKNTHRALDDIYESIAELKTYLSYVKT